MLLLMFSDVVQVEWGWGVVVSVIRKAPKSQLQLEQPNGTVVAQAVEDAAAFYILDTLLACAPGSTASGKYQPARPGDADAEMVVVPVQLPLLTALSSLRVTLPGDLRPPENRWVLTYHGPLKQSKLGALIPL